MSFGNGPSIVTNGLILALDANDLNSYPGTGTTWYDLSGQGAHAYLTGSVFYTGSVASSPGYFNIPVAADANYMYSTISQSYFDLTLVIQPDFTFSNGGYGSGIIATSTAAARGDESLRLTTTLTPGVPWTINNPGNINDWANPATTYYLNGIPNTSTVTLVNGWNVIGGTRTNTTNGAFTSPFAYFIGGGYSGRNYQGKIASLYMYNRSLSAAEQLQNYNALKSRFNLT